MKRRLELMPEVLPAPTKVGTSAVRARTMARLRVMAAVGASIAAACGGSTTSSGGGSSSGGSSGGGSSGGRDGGLPDPNKPDSDPGYGVVDPLPQPACFDYANPPTATAVFVGAEEVGVDGGTPDGGPDGGPSSPYYRYVHVVVTLNQKDVAVGTVTLQNPDGTDIAVFKNELKDGAIDLVLGQASGGNFDTRIDIQTSCAKGPTRVFVQLTQNAQTPGKFDIQVNFNGG